MATPSYLRLASDPESKRFRDSNSALFAYGAALQAVNEAQQAVEEHDQPGHNAEEGEGREAKLEKLELYRNEAASLLLGLRRYTALQLNSLQDVSIARSAAINGWRGTLQYGDDLAAEEVSQRLGEAVDLCRVTTHFTDSSSKKPF